MGIADQHDLITSFFKEISNVTNTLLDVTERWLAKDFRGALDRLKFSLHQLSAVEQILHKCDPEILQNRHLYLAVIEEVKALLAPLNPFLYRQVETE